MTVSELNPLTDESEYSDNSDTDLEYGMDYAKAIEPCLELFVSDAKEARKWARKCAPPAAELHTLNQPLGESLGAQREELTSICTQIRDLYTRLHEKRIHYTKLAATCAPIHKIPDEILSHIFLDNSFSISFAGEHRDGVLLRLRLTCRRWNKIILDTPRLWTNLLISNPSFLYNTKIRRLWSKKQLSHWLRRSRGAPLDLEIALDGLSLHGFPSSFDSIKGRRCVEAIVPLVEQSSRWKDLAMDSHASYIVYRAFEALKPAEARDKTSPAPRSPSFETLNLLSMSWRDSPEQAKSILDIGGFRASNLKKLYLHAFSFDINEYSRVVSATPNITFLSLICGKVIGIVESTTPVAHCQVEEIHFIVPSDWRDKSVLHFFRALLDGSSSLTKVCLQLHQKSDSVFSDKKNATWIRSRNPLTSVTWFQYVLEPGENNATSRSGHDNIPNCEPGPISAWFPNLYKFDFVIRSSVFHRDSTPYFPKKLLPSLMLLPSVAILTLGFVVLDGTALGAVIERLSSKRRELRVGLDGTVVLCKGKTWEPDYDRRWWDDVRKEAEDAANYREGDENWYDPAFHCKTFRDWSEVLRKVKDEPSLTV